MKYILRFVDENGHLTSRYEMTVDHKYIHRNIHRMEFPLTSKDKAYRWDEKRIAENQRDDLKAGWKMEFVVEEVEK